MKTDGVPKLDARTGSPSDPLFSNPFSPVLMTEMMPSIRRSLDSVVMAAAAFFVGRSFWWVALAAITMVAPTAMAQDRRAPRPTFDVSAVQQAFVSSISDSEAAALPTQSELRSLAVELAKRSVDANQPASNESSDSLWKPLITAASIEDEVKRMKLEYDQLITTPGAFNSGGYQDARVDLTVLASLFAVISDYSGEVRWKDEAATARNVFARTAFNCKAGSTQVYNEAKLRKEDLQMLLTGTGIGGGSDEPEPNDWGQIADRSPLMEYAEEVVSRLEDHTVDTETIRAEEGKVRRDAELLAMLGEVLVREGLDEWDDEDYQKLSRGMSEQSRLIIDALDRMDFEAAESAAAEMRTRCDACHEQYR